MLFTTTLSTPLILGLGLAFVASSLSRDTPAAQGLTGVVTTSSITATQWSELNSTLGGKLSAATPFAAPCFDVVNGASNEDKSGCAAIQSGYRDPFYRASRFNAFLWPAWEGCTALEETCQLDPSSTNNSIAWEGKNCAQGSLSEYFVEASSPQDVQNVLRFVRDTGVLVSIKNSGHDFGGRGAQIGSLSIWTHNLNTISHDPSFVPEGALEYTGGTSVLTLGAGVSFYSAYEFADAHNLTVVGGYHPTVGASGGWLMGGGHSILSPVFGLGVDRVLQFKIVTPDGNYLTVNEFLHPDLFWALRGGGGGTFGVVIESTIKVEPKMKLQVASLSFTQNSDNARGFLKLVIDNSVKWGEAGWGGHISPRNLVSVTPLLSLQEAQESMKDAVDYTLSQNGTAVIEELPSWLAFFNKYVKSSAIGGYNAIGGAWLMPNTLFDSEQTKEQLLDALMRMLTAGNPHITTATPYLYDYAEGTTSAAPAWRNSLWHAVFQYEFPWNATIDGVREHFQTITDNIQNLRDLSPESGAYGTEGDIYELDHERAFWGDNYPKLLELKQKYDPNGILDCWKCVGWRGPSDPRYKCYVDAQKSATDLF